MRIDRVELTNFRCFESLSFDLNPHFTLFIGDNGSGKTAIVEALAAAASVWLKHPPDLALVNSDRPIKGRDATRRYEKVEGGVKSRGAARVAISASGLVVDDGDAWTYRFEGDERASYHSHEGLNSTIDKISRLYREDLAGVGITFPITAYYGALRGQSESRVSSVSSGPAMRWAAFFECFSGLIPTADVNEWFKREFIARGNRSGHFRPSFLAVRQAVLAGVTGATELFFDSDYNQVVVALNGVEHQLGDLSAGQRMMFAMVADIAIKCVTQNAYLLNDDNPYKTIEETPGIVLIDELDVHLHPKWQRGVAASLKKAFPKIQFVCTSHSPQIIGELHPDEIRILEDGKVFTPPRSYGMDSNSVLTEIQSAPDRNPETADLIDRIARAISMKDFPTARTLIADLAARVTPDAPEITKAEAMLAFLKG